MKKRMIITICIFFAAIAVFLWYRTEQNSTKEDKILVKSDSVPVAAQPVYYMKKQGGSVVIYHYDDTLYEYTDLEMEFLPEQVQKELDLGIYFHSQEELYEFLETYSS